MKQLQAEHREWLVKLYPGQIPEFPAAGMVEEAGELMRAVLKCQQANGGKHPESRYADADFTALLVDAVGDCAIFAVSYCNASGHDFSEMLEQAKCQASVSGVETVFNMAAELALCAATAAKTLGWGAVVKYLKQLILICRTWNINFEDAVTTTWAEVKERS